MKRFLLIFSVMASIGVTIGWFFPKGHQTMDALSFVEALSDCELPNGYAPDGVCVSDAYNNHFCATPPNSADKKNCVMGLGVK